MYNFNIKYTKLVLVCIQLFILLFCDTNVLYVCTNLFVNILLYLNVNKPNLHLYGFSLKSFNNDLSG